MSKEHPLKGRNLSIYPDPKLYAEFEARIEEINRSNRGNPKIMYGDKKRVLEKAMRMWIDSGEGF